MKKILVSLIVAVSALSVLVPEAQAKRMGGGGSIGKQSQNVNRQSYPPSQPAQSQAAAAAAAKPATPAAATPKPASPWKNILGGALLGLGLGALLSHLGLGGAMASMLSTLLMVALLAAAGMFIYRMLRRKQEGNGGVRPAYAAAPAGYTPEIGSRLEPMQPMALRSDAQASSSGGDVGSIPAGFDVDGFLRQAKAQFIRLQAVWDKADINDLREFTTSELFAELRLQLQERGASPNHTDVVSLDATLLGVETVGSEYIASIKFSGMIKESEHAPAEAFTEVWNLSKPVSGQSGWLLAGIRQVS